ncbi:Protein TolQ [BD1-7 clade bacterium]|uniref:Tol-Pal system protein TolQ n=1 Tax=BD1-7 clade bacterium TaxID=2029982 RepID=A0A5S9MWJ9_9GAMM|nr:Protein TolQ [BD1-7 clade bacterium]
MEESLSFWSLISNAGIVVQAVMLILFSASMASWAMIVQRVRYFSAANKAANAFEDEFWSGVDLAQLYRTPTDEENRSGMEVIFRAGFQEYTRLKQQSSADPDAVMEGCQRAMRVALSKEEERLDEHLPFLASVGSTSPYVGLFGTVWGIMNSFRSLANMQQATIATVAPGISEALVATAIGLFAAIPAVMAYNRFAARSDSMLKRYQTFSDEFSSILHRQAHAKGQ